MGDELLKREGDRTLHKLSDQVLYGMSNIDLDWFYIHCLALSLLVNYNSTCLTHPICLPIVPPFLRETSQRLIC
ncbi:hypothetical protein [Gloeocapsopsis sp. IPPAS B-1203]|uniref:hypothetical protein n=1 Tax=Gloeocapsopsis sp. IPPAS B-1203 TaxID=2049454 RepID=UPI00117FD353|nr:hypothetical protein [Gloeocapsopsis sp. IPPAS B-1203]